MAINLLNDLSTFHYTHSRILMLAPLRPARTQRRRDGTVRSRGAAITAHRSHPGIHCMDFSCGSRQAAAGHAAAATSRHRTSRGTGRSATHRSLCN